ncbi:hypothetical protein IFM89_004511 [Coptis chinensis]|uniref:Uncharacterized protein n=1 Tax=Coptis chinensis TaxID=261450 RepID=A0A835LDD8_9MAGN|nr:hypothetical protein IFM89_004511 [Coptis chinensis]
MELDKNNSSYVPPPYYIPLEQSEIIRNANDTSSSSPPPPLSHDDEWTSGICACCDDMHSCCLGLTCPCFLFGKNAEFLGSGTLAGSCITHFILWGIVNAICCMLTDGTLCCLPGCFVACYACGYRRTLRSKYDLPEVPCGDLTTHLFCHMCAICQEYREIRERSIDSRQLNFKLAEVIAPPVQRMDLTSKD